MPTRAAQTTRTATAPSKPQRRVAAAPAEGKPPRRSHAQRREESERRLLDAAMDIVAQRGSVRMTLAEVGEAAGYSRGLPAHRFGNKAGLVRALAVYIGERFGQQRNSQQARTPGPEPGLPAILANIHFYFSRKGGAWTATRALLVMMSEGGMAGAGEDLQRELAAYNRSALAWFEQHIAAGIERGQIAPGTDAEVTAVILLGAMRGVMMQWLVDDRIRLNMVRDRLLQIVELLLANRPALAAEAGGGAAVAAATRRKPGARRLDASA